MSGTATRADGSTTAPYTTRIIVTRPTDRRQVQRHGPARLGQRHRPVRERRRHDAGPRDADARGLRLRARQRAVGGRLLHAAVRRRCGIPVRYAALNHPGDDYAFDMFTQIAQAFEAPERASTRWARIGGGERRARPRRRSVAVGEPARRLRRDVAAGAPRAVGVIDGILVHGNVPGDKTFGSRLARSRCSTCSATTRPQDDGVDPADGRPELPAVGDRRRRPRRLLHRLPVRVRPRPSRRRSERRSRPRRSSTTSMTAAGNYGEVIHPLLAVCIAAGAAMPMHYADSAAIHQLTSGSPPAPRRRTAPASRSTAARSPPTSTATRSAASGCHRSTFRSPTTCRRRVSSAASRFRSLTARSKGSTRRTPRTTRHEGAHRPGRRRRVAPSRGRDDLMRRACAASVRFGEARADCPDVRRAGVQHPLWSRRRTLAPQATSSPVPVAMPTWSCRLPSFRWPRLCVWSHRAVGWDAGR